MIQHKDTMEMIPLVHDTAILPIIRALIGFGDYFVFYCFFFFWRDELAYQPTAKIQDWLSLKSFVISILASENK